MMNPPISPIKIPYWLMSLWVLMLLSLTACGGAANEAPQAPPGSSAVLPTTTALFVAREEASYEEMAAEEAEAAPAEAEVAAKATSTTGDLAASTINFNRLIIKNAELELLVEDTDTAINRSLGVVIEYGGYVVSNRTWFKDELKYATLTIGVPVENFEEMLRRLKDLAISITYETASGQDVTDQFVDLESRLRNQEATAERIRDFLNETKNVEEALRVNNQLTAVEAEIEQIKGQMVYLRDRAAFSTITLQLTPQPLLPTPTPSPTPTPTPEPWSPGRTFDQATGVTGQAATTLLQVSVDLLIWLVVVVLPFILPLLGLIWAGAWVARRVGQNRGIAPK